MLFYEGRHIFGAVLVQRDTDHFKSLWAVFLLELYKPGYFNDARSAPGGPEIYQHDFILEIRHVDFSAIEVGQFEVSGGLAPQRGDGRRHLDGDLGHGWFG